MPPLHPMLVHFPIAFLVLELFLIIRWARTGDAAYERFARLVFFLAFFCMLGALASGYREATEQGHKIQGAVARHYYAALTLFFFTTLRLFQWRSVKPGLTVPPALLTAASAAGVLLMAAAAFLGGRLVYS